MFKKKKKNSKMMKELKISAKTVAERHKSIQTQPEAHIDK